MMRRAVLAAVTLALLGATAPLRADVPNTVTITARSPSASESRAPRRGLGFVAEADGFVLTTYENVTDPSSSELLSELRVHIWEEDETVDATIVGVEPTLNLAVLKLETEKSLRASQIRRDPDLGGELRAPTRLDPAESTIATGKLSALNSKECYQESLIATMFQAEMQIPPAVAGAPVYDANGSVIALYTAYGHDDRLASDPIHLLPVFVAFNIYESIKTKGSLVSPWTGFSVRSLTDAEARIFPIPTGHRSAVAIEYVWEGGPAEKMGVREGDFLIQISQNRIGDVADFQKWLYMYGVGHQVKLVFVRGGTQLLATDYLIEERPAWAKPR